MSAPLDPTGARASAALMALEERYGAHNYHPLPVVVARAAGCWVQDPEGRRYLDFLSAYSALNQGHRHPRIIEALKEQADRVTLTSRAFHNDQLGPFLAELCTQLGFARALPMNTGAEAVETGIKACRRWGERVKGVPAGRGEIIVCTHNFHGRTTTIVGFSSDGDSRDGFGPYGPGFVAVPFGDAAALEAAITPNTVAFLVEPIQAEAGILVPPVGYLRAAREVCTRHRVLFFADEIQTGLGRTGRWLACDWEDVRPDVVSLGKALGGGVLPVSALLADDEVMDVFTPGSHGSTFGGNPLAAAVGRASLAVLRDEGLIARSEQLGRALVAGIRGLGSRHVADVRGRGLLVGVEIAAASGPARPFCERLLERGLLCKDTHGQTIRLAPPLVLSDDELAWALAQLGEVLA